MTLCGWLIDIVSSSGMNDIIQNLHMVYHMVKMKGLEAGWLGVSTTNIWLLFDKDDEEGRGPTFHFRIQ
jgi:hypothetical protein